MQQHWFYDVWAFIGAGGAIVMVAIMMTTDTFRSNLTVSRWRDVVWLAWLAAPLYWVHQLEEYSLPVMGLPYSLPDMVCGQFGFAPYPECPIPMTFYPVVNISLMWFGAPLAAYICRRNVLIGLSSWGLIMANGFVHSFGGITQAPITPDSGPPPSCLFRCHSGSFTPARFVDRTAAKSWARQSSPGPSLMPFFSSATACSRPGCSAVRVWWSMVRWSVSRRSS